MHPETMATPRNECTKAELSDNKGERKKTKTKLALNEIRVKCYRSDTALSKFKPVVLQLFL